MRTPPRTPRGYRPLTDERMGQRTSTEREAIDRSITRHGHLTEKLVKENKDVSGKRYASGALC